MAKFKHHIFVCENVRPPGSKRGCCAEKGSENIRQAMKDSIDQRGWSKIVRANKAGCLDQCENGITMVIYPDNIWYGKVQMQDVEEILDALREGKIIERLRIPDAALTGREGDL